MFQVAAGQLANHQGMRPYLPGLKQLPERRIPRTQMINPDSVSYAYEAPVLIRYT